MFNIGGSELIVILFVALIFLGPERLPTAAKQVGKTIASLRSMAQGFQREFEDAVSIAEDSAREVEARAKGAELVAASKTAEETSDEGNGSSAADTSDSAATVGFDPTAEPDRTEKPLSSEGPMFHSAGPDVGPKIARRSSNGDSADSDSAENETAATTAADAADERAAEIADEAEPSPPAVVASSPASATTVPAADVASSQDVENLDS